jgi:hypothetical protein
VVGCVLDTRRNALYFTLNGALLGSSPAVRGVQGRFFPCVWLSAQGARVAVNFGQRPFRYDFVSTLGADYSVESGARDSALEQDDGGRGAAARRAPRTCW